MLTFESFVPGTAMGAHALALDRSVVDLWLRLFPADVRHLPSMPPGMISIVTMRAFAAVAEPRPPGNVHGAQRFDLVRLPRLGDRLETRIACASKELKRERRWVRFSSETRGSDGDILFTGLITVLWAL